MSRVSIESINYFRSGDKSKTFSLDLRYGDGRPPERNAVFVGSIEKNDDSMDPDGKSNKFSNKTTVGVVVHPMYDIKDICVRSKYVGSAGAEIGVYSPSMSKNPVGFAQTGGTAYILAHDQNNGLTYGMTNLRQKRRQSAGTVVDENYSTQVSETEKDVFNYGSNSKAGFKESFNTENDLLGIDHAVVVEIPQSKDWADYEAGDIYGDAVFTKSSYDGQYSTDMPLSTRIENAREYCGIGECCGTVYLKYFDRNGYDETSRYDDGEINRVQTQKSSKGYPYQKIETFEYMNRFGHQALHKSNLFSIQVNGLELSAAADNSRLTQQLKLNIKNTISRIVKDVCPVNTQLFDVYF